MTDKARLCLRLDLIFRLGNHFVPLPLFRRSVLSRPVISALRCHRASLRRSNARYGCDDRKRENVCHSRGRKRLLPLRMLLRLTFFCVSLYVHDYDINVSFSAIGLLLQL